MTISVVEAAVNGEGAAKRVDGAFVLAVEAEMPGRATPRVCRVAGCWLLSSTWTSAGGFEVAFAVIGAPCQAGLVPCC